MAMVTARSPAHRTRFHPLAAPTADKPSTQGAFAAVVEAPDAVNCAWFRGGWFDTLTMVWKDVVDGICEEAPAHSRRKTKPRRQIYVPIHLAPVKKGKSDCSLLGMCQTQTCAPAMTAAAGAPALLKC